MWKTVYLATTIPAYMPTCERIPSATDGFRFPRAVANACAQRGHRVDLPTSTCVNAAALDGGLTAIDTAPVPSLSLSCHTVPQDCPKLVCTPVVVPPLAGIRTFAAAGHECAPGDAEW